MLKEVLQRAAPNQVELSDPYKDVELTDDELQALIREAKRQKAARIKEREYWDKITQPIEHPSFTFYQHIQRLKADGFKIDKYNHDVIRLLCLYFAGDSDFEGAQEGFSLDKGLLLFGNVGCGKTSLIKFFQVNQVNSFIMVSCRSVAADYANAGPQESKRFIDYYSGLVRPTVSQNLFGHRELGLCFDDLGTEGDKKNFGNELNVMEEVLTNRYDKLQELKGLTHVTTNLTASEIEERYGTRLKSRMREMFNMLTFPEDAPDRRK